MNLVEFLLERFDDDEDLARMAGGRRWHETFVGIDDEDGSEILYVDDGPGITVGYKHVVRHDPANVLADLAAKRGIVEMATPEWSDDGEPVGGGYVEAWWDTVRLLALPYADHPDYREEWRP